MSNISDWFDYKLIRLSNSNGVKVDISDLGATIVNYLVPAGDKEINIVLGYDTPEEYLSGGCYFSAVVGPWANRIAEGRFELNGETIQVHQNEGSNHLHGGKGAIDTQKWVVEASTANSVILSIKVPEGFNGYPANSELAVSYTLTDDNELVIDYKARVDKPMPINLTQHAYFNLTGAEATHLNHEMQIHAEHFLAVDEKLIPCEKRPVAGTSMDFRTAKKLGQDIQADEEQVTLSKGFDHCWCLDFDMNEEPKLAVTVTSPESGMTLETYTNQIGIQLYSGNYIDNEKGRDGQVYQQYDGFCLETQLYPDQVNMNTAEQAILKPGQEYRHTTIYKTKVK
ncbi:galactose-1-epimerase [Endozoicomonas sp. OPT23]|uniref:aldose epimerase family protein n=1 Tax=Endozoicomonas sp. OPT23 TaxID=2072845 RepID=UPI00129A539C|nr:aldose epimerase family protein [Endozoicomonas sp. OPT23]MRI33190.1 galactose-1-epimerase [Endozoicomonas sp. OPT23]